MCCSAGSKQAGWLESSGRGQPCTEYNCKLCITVFWYVRVGKVLQLSTKQSKLMTISAKCKDTDLSDIRIFGFRNLMIQGFSDLGIF